MSTTLKSISTSAGFLQNCRVDFSPGLTCIIGARGTCKSTLLESIRFAFDHQKDRVAELTREALPNEGRPAGLVTATLRAGYVRCEVQSRSENGDSSYVLEREVGNPPRVFVDGVREHADHGILQKIEIFSQGDLQRIAEEGNDHLRLELIDRPHADTVQKLREQRDVATSTLMRLGPELRAARAQAATLRHELLPLSSLKEQLRQTKEQAPSLSPELTTEQALFERRARALSTFRDAAQVSDVLERTEETLASQQVELRRAFMALSAEVDLGIDGDVSLVKSLQEELGKARESLRRAQWLKLQDAVSSLAQRFEQNNDQYYRLRQEQQAANESLKQQTALTRGIEHIEKRAQELEAVIALERGLLDKRDAARAVIARVDDRIYELRIQEVDAINREHGDSVFLTLRTGTGAPAYSAHLSRLLGGSRIRAQEEVAAALALTFPPSELIDIVEGGNGQPLADALQRDAAQMNRVVAHLADHQGLYELEATPAVSGLEIALFDGNQRKPVESLSNGQRATALLPLILRPLPYPLLFDQPEDDLDNKFIYNSLIKSIRGLKHQRQLVFVTHNANIPVLGGADRVVVMRMRSPDSADEPLVGTVEERKQEVLDLLEGGAEAFRRRERQYHDLLSKDVVGGDDAADKGAP